MELKPARFKVLVHERAKYACEPCGGEVVIAATGDRLIESGLPGYGSLVDVLVRKYTEHVPLHRLRDSYGRLGVDLSPSTLSGWVMAGADLAGPLTHAIWAQADAYVGYDALFPAPGSKALDVGCWAHVRRRFVKALEQDKRAAVAVQLLRLLYQIPHDATERRLEFAGRKALRAANLGDSWEVGREYISSDAAEERAGRCSDVHCQSVVGAEAFLGRRRAGVEWSRELVPRQ